MDVDVHDDVMGLILERVDSLVSLVRAAAVCRRWRRTVADPAFLRRFRSLRAAAAAHAVAGYYHNNPNSTTAGGGPPAFVPSSPPVVDARHCRLDFLEGGAEAWAVLDSRGSLLLMQRTATIGCQGMVVCEPLTRSCKVIPPPVDFGHDCHLLTSCLSDGYVDEVGSRISMSNFRVHRVVRGHGHLYTTIFTWADNMGLLSQAEINLSASRITLSKTLGPAGGSWYFYERGRTLIVLDGSTGNFSNSVLPPLEDWDSHMCNVNFFVTDGRDGKPYIVTVFNGTMKVYAQLNGCGWALEKSILLSEATQGLPGYQPWFFRALINLTRGGGFVIMSPVFGGTRPFSVDLETMEVAPVAETMEVAPLVENMKLPMVYRCELPWPPVLRACLDP